MLKIGCHLSISKGLVAAGEEAIRLGANTMQIFISNPRGGNKSSVTENDMIELRTFAEKHNISEIVVHAPYTVNLCSKEQYTRNISKQAMIRDIRLLNHIPGNYYNIHPGCHIGNGVERGIRFITDALNEMTSLCAGTTILLETMSGKGTEIGASFNEIAEMIHQVSDKDKIGVCLDTCHIFSAGYDIVNHLDNVLDEFDKIIGLKKLKAIHLNDSLTPMGSNKDRHAKIGEGTIGLRAILNVINHRSLRELPFILETPNDNAGYSNEISTLKSGYVALK